MPVSIRRGRTSDAAAVGDICYRAFKTIAEAHNFPPDVPSPEVAAGLLGTLIAHDGIYDVVAEVDKRIAGSNFLDERNPISGVGPITVDPSRQNDGVGHDLMRATWSARRRVGSSGSGSSKRRTTAARSLCISSWASRPASCWSACKEPRRRRRYRAARSGPRPRTICPRAIVSARECTVTIAAASWPTPSRKVWRAWWSAGAASPDTRRRSPTSAMRSPRRTTTSRH